jgi:hypothetical protein
MARGTFTPFQFLPPYNFGAPGNANTQGGGGGMGPHFRDALDAQRSMYNRTPEAMFPDGYLGTIHSRRGDRLLDNLKTRQNQRSYQRGVHKGERIDKADYFWPQALQPDRGLMRMAQGIPDDTWVLVEREAPKGQYIPQWGPKDIAMAGAVSGVGGRTANLRRLAPSWR